MKGFISQFKNILLQYYKPPEPILSFESNYSQLNKLYPSTRKNMMMHMLSKWDLKNNTIAMPMAIQSSIKPITFFMTITLIESLYYTICINSYLFPNLKQHHSSDDFIMMSDTASATSGSILSSDLENLLITSGTKSIILDTAS